MFKKILIANRGEIACRVAATARRLGIQTVAVYSRADQGAQHTLVCDEAVYVGDDTSESGGRAAKDSYLRADSVIAAALQTGAQAIHPGYGFLSENTAFAAACLKEGIVFIGPPASAIEAMGLKAESKRLMHAAGVPLVPGYHGESQDPSLLEAEAAKIGYPVLIKASAGGGGRGMRVVERAEDFAAALASCQREAQNSFNNAAVLIEKYVQRPRHIELQVFADTQGHCIHLFERDCSVQRRHQKVLEEAPAPGLPQSLRERMGAAAVAAAKAVGYVGAGTVEFIVSQTAYDQPEAMSFYFMEMNTRLQVEHPVTEAITGLDLVEWQLRVAAGEPLPLAQHEVHIQGHAIEARICAENPRQGFVPAIGELVLLETPQTVSFKRSDVLPRLDSGFVEGDLVSPFYDSMLAKLIVHGRDRAEALQKLDRALAKLHIGGLQTNVDFLKDVIATDSFQHVKLDTALIEREKDRLFKPINLDTDASKAIATAATVRMLRTEEEVGKTGSPWAIKDAWRIQRDITAGGNDRASRRSWPVTWVVNDQPVTVAIDAHLSALARQAHSQEAGPIHISQRGKRYFAFTPWGQIALHRYDPLSMRTVATSANPSKHEQRVMTPMPGTVIAVNVKVGDEVQEGQVLVVLEAMKMEHSLRASQRGFVLNIGCVVGEQVGDGTLLLMLGEKPASKT